MQELSNQCLWRTFLYPAVSPLSLSFFGVTSLLKTIHGSRAIFLQHYNSHLESTSSGSPETGAVYRALPVYKVGSDQLNYRHFCAQPEVLFLLINCNITDHNFLSGQLVYRSGQPVSLFVSYAITDKENLLICQLRGWVSRRSVGCQPLLFDCLQVDGQLANH